MTKRGPQLPKWLSPEAQKEWRRVAPLLADRLTDSDYGMLESYCTAVGSIRELQVILNKEGLIVETENGPKPHPASRMQGLAMNQVRGLGEQLGLSLPCILTRLAGRSGCAVSCAA